MVEFITKGVIFVIIWAIGIFACENYCKKDNPINFTMFLGVMLALFADIISKALWAVITTGAVG